jgi:hypothetical protein
MPVFSDELVAYLKTKTALTDLVSTRIEPSVLRSNTYPAIVYRRIDTPQLQARFVKPRYQFDLWGPDYAVLWRVVDRLKTALHEYHGLMGSTHVRCQVVNAWDDWDQELALFVTHVDAKLIFIEPAA